MRDRCAKELTKAIAVYDAASNCLTSAYEQNKK